MSESKGKYKFKRRNGIKSYNEEERIESNESSKYEEGHVTHYVERGRKKFDWLEAFEKKGGKSRVVEGKFRHTSKSDTASDSEEEKVVTSKLLEKKVDDENNYVTVEEAKVLEPLCQESTGEPKLPSKKKQMESDDDESEPENTWGSDSPPGPSCGSLLRFVDQFEKEEAANKPGEVVEFINGSVMRVKKNKRKRR